MAKRKKQITIYLTDELDMLLDRHRAMTGESANAFVTRLLRSYLEDSGSVPGHVVPSNGSCRRVIRVDDDLFFMVREHAYDSEETATALVRRLLASWFSHRD